MPYKYGPGDPEFLNRDAEAEPGPSPYFAGFRRKLAAVDCAVVAAVGVAALVLGWDFHRFAGMLALAGTGAIGLGMLAFVGNQAFSNYEASSHVNYHALGPPLPVDHWARRVAVLLLIAGVSIAAVGAGLAAATA